MNGWIKLHRQLLENAIAQKPMYAWLWTSLLLMANHEDNEFIWNGEKQVCRAGQILTGREALAKQTGLSPSTVENVLKYLENEQQIKQQKTTKFRLITIVKWKDYQINEQQIKQQNDNRMTTERQQNDTNKNDKNDKNDKNEKNTYMSADADIATKEKSFSKEDISHTQSFVEYVRSCNPAFAAKYPNEFTNIEKWAAEIDKMKRIDKVTDDQISFVIAWLSAGKSESALFWQKNILSTATLRRQWQKLVAAVKFDHEKLQNQKGKTVIIS